MIAVRSHLRRLYSPDGFRGPVVTLLSGTTLTLLLSYLAVPILTRIFTPEEFGVSDYFVMIVSVLVTAVSLRYEDAILLPERDEEAASIFWLAASLTLVAVAIVALTAFWRAEIAAFLRVEGMALWLWLVAPTLLLMRVGKLAETWFIRKKAFRAITGGDVSNKLAMVSARIGLGAGTSMGAGGLIVGFFAAHVVSAAYYVVAMTRRADTGDRMMPRMRSAAPEATLPALRVDVRRPLIRFREMAVRYRRFPQYSTPAALLNAVVARLPVIFLPIYFTIETVGLFGRAFVALAVPLGLVGTAVSQVFFVHAAEARRGDTLAALTGAVHGRLVMIGIFPTLVLIAAGPDLFAFVFGPEWREAGTFAQFLAPWFFLGGVASPLSRLFDVLERQRVEFVISLATCASLSAVLIVGGRSGDVVLTMALVGIAGVLVRTIQIAAALGLAGVRTRQAARPYARYLLVGLPLAAILFVVQDLLPPWGTAALAVFFGATFAAVVTWQDGLLREPRAERDPREGAGS